jgi:2-polyprenyl-3-methyl-5-hydroxy-6-metoxy-1,4-benzoquinol methylase
LKILDLGSGSIYKLGSAYDCIDITYADRRDFPGVDTEDMEQLSYADNAFDIVVCVNALDHTPDAKAAVKEMLRVSRGLVYIDCALIQRTTSGKQHYWDAEEDGTFTSKDDSFNLKDFSFQIELLNNNSERRYNHIHAVHINPL